MKSGRCPAARNLAAWKSGRCPAAPNWPRRNPAVGKIIRPWPWEIRPRLFPGRAKKRSSRGRIFPGRGFHGRMFFRPRENPAVAGKMIRPAGGCSFLDSSAGKERRSWPGFYATAGVFFPRRGKHLAVKTTAGDFYVAADVNSIAAFLLTARRCCSFFFYCYVCIPSTFYQGILKPTHIKCRDSQRFGEVLQRRET